MGHHYAIWASDSNILLALISGTDDITEILMKVVLNTINIIQSEFLLMH
jgi:hypothetical protein